MKFVSVLIQHHAGPTGDVLVCKKKNGAWEFPTDTVRVGETAEEAVARLASEQLHMTVKVGKMTLVGRHMPNDGYAEHLLCGNIRHNTNTKHDYHEYYEAVDVWQTEPQAGVYGEFKWVHPSELGSVEFVGDDMNFMAKYDPWIRGDVVPDRRMY